MPPRKPRGPREIRIQSPPERLIPSTSYRRSLDLVSSWCEAVITLISSGIAFPPRANFVSTVTSPRGVRALRARRRQEPQQPRQAPRNQPETRGHPQIPTPGSPASPVLLVPSLTRVLLVSQPLKGVICCWEHPPGSGGREWLRGEGPEAGGPQMHRWISEQQSLGSFPAAGICCNPICP